jgi:TolA-binding protein
MAIGSFIHSKLTSCLVLPWAACLALVGLAGCNDDKEEARPAAEAAVPAERPAVLANAIASIKANRPAEAQAPLEAFLEQEPKSICRPEALYLLGQSLAAQGDYEHGKKKLDAAIDATDDRTLKGLAMLGRADCNMALKKYALASRQYHWLESMYREVKAIPQDELMYKLGMATKKAGNNEVADYWFNKVVELYATGPYAALARQENSRLTPADPDAEPVIYSLEVANFVSEKKAEAEAEVLRAKGYRDVQMIPTTRNGLPTYEVHVGKFLNRSDAFAAQTDAKIAGLPTLIRPATIEPLK